MATDNFPRINPGERAIISGRTGSGKSTLGCWILERSPGHWIVLNPKHTKAYDGLNDSHTIKGIDLGKIDRSLREHRFTIVNPTGDQATPEVLDEFVGYIHDTYKNIGVCADELYTLHNNGRAGKGLLGLLTRGRELKQAFLGMTQRPAGLSQFNFSESQYICGMSLTLEDDRKRLYQMTGRREFLEKMEPHEWLWYYVSQDHLRKFGPVPT